MKKVFISFLCLLLTLSLASCDLLGGSLSDYVTEYTQNAALELYEVPEIFPRDANQTPCISGSFPITLYLRNPMKYQIIFEYTFKNTYIQTLYDTQFKQTNPIQYVPAATDLSAYNMIFPAEFIEAIDTGAGSGSDPKDISGTVNAFDKETLRPFGSLDLTLRADSAPMPVCNGLMQLDRDPSENDPLYILCFEIPRSGRNNDFDTIKINNSTWKIEYDASRVSIPDGIKVTPYDGNRGTLIVNPSKKDNPDTPAVKTYPLETGSVDVFEPSNPESFDTFYYITEDKQTDTKTLYQITITDKAGLSTTCTLSNKAEKLVPVNFSQTVTQGQVFLADIDNELKLTIKPGNKTTEGSGLNMLSYVEYMIEMVDEYGNLHNSEGWKRADTADGAITLNLAPTAYLNCSELLFYRISARTKGSGYLTSDVITLPDFEVLRSNHFFVNQSGDDNNQGTLTSSYKTFNNTILQIIRYLNWLTDHYPDHLPSDGFYIDIPENYTVTGSDDVFNNSYLINNNIDSSTTFSGKLTIQGVDDTGKNAKLRTINACGSEQVNRGCVSWTNGTLNMKNLQFRGGYLSSASYDTVCYGAGVQIVDSDDSPVTVTLTNCEFEKNIITSTWNRDEDPWPITFCGGAGLAVITGNTRSLVTIDGCTFTGNSASGNSIGAGICILSTVYGNPTGTVIIKGNTTVSNNSIEMFQGAGVYTDGKLIIESATITGNTTAEEKGAGAGFTANTCSDVTIKGKTIIENNTNLSGGPSNAYLACNTDDPENLKDQKTFTIAGDISGSRIGVTTGKQPAVGEPVPFVDGWQASYGQPANFFTSDAGCGITTDGSGTPVLGVNSGTGGYHFTEDVTISVSSDNYIPGVEKQITVSASLDGAEPVDITNDVTSWHLELTENGETISSSWYSVSGNTLTLKQALPRNTYTLYIDIVYNGRHYSNSIAITPPPSVASLTAAPTGGTVTAASQSDLAQLATWVNGGSSLENVTILLDSDVTITGTYRAIGSSTKFQGTFDGQGHTVNINSQTTDATYYGLFGDVYGGTIKNVTVTGSITTSGNRKYIGGIVGHLSSGTIENCINNVTISGATYAGGIVGFPVSCTIKNCINNASLSGTEYAGGIGGSKNASSTENTVSIINCVNNGDVTVSTDNGTSGGLMGYVDSISNYKLNFNNAANIGTITNFNGPSSEIYGSDIRRINTLKNVIYLQNSGSGTFSNNNDNETLYSESSYAAEIHAETTLSAIVSRLNSWITSQPADERGTYKKWKVSADGTKIVFEDEE